MTQAAPSIMDPPPFSISREVFGIDWAHLSPIQLGNDGVALRWVAGSEIGHFLAENREELIYADAAQSPFLQLQHSAQKAQFCEAATDSFLLEKARKPIGVFVGQPWDWSTYYMRYMALLPAFRHRNLVRDLVEVFADILVRHGFERMESDAGVSHRSQLRTMIGAGFHMMGTLHSERWGATAHLVRFLSARHESVFTTQFCAGPRSRMTKPDRR